MLRLRDYPREFVIGDSIWSLKFKRNIGETTTHITWGLCDVSTNTIYIRLGQTPEERLKTLCHELIHAAEWEFDIEIPHKLVHQLETPLARFIIDNYLGAA